MNATIAYITFRSMLGRRRALLLFALPAILLILAIVLRATGFNDLETSTNVMEKLGLGVILPLLGLIAGTGVIGPEIDDGQIMYILTKPIPRQVITTTKLAVAIALIFVFAAVPTFVAGLILVGTTAQFAIAFAVAMLAGGIAYCAVFIAIAVASRFAVVIGLLYALVWESLIGNFAPGAKSLSIQQWALSVAHSLTDATAVTADVHIGTALVMLIIVAAVGSTLAALRLRTLPIASAE
jgi:ABC-2 type transport system permease protein